MILPLFSETLTHFLAFHFVHGETWSNSVSVIDLFPIEYSLALPIMCGCVSNYDWPFAVDQISEHAQSYIAKNKEERLLKMVFVTLNSEKLLKIFLKFTGRKKYTWGIFALLSWNISSLHSLYFISSSLVTIYHFFSQNVSKCLKITLIAITMYLVVNITKT